MWRGRIEVRRAFVLAEQLKTIPDSRYRAATWGDPLYLGYGVAEIIAADQYDLIKSFFAFFVGEKLTADDLYPRPRSANTAPRETTIADFDIDNFMGIIGG